MTKNNEKMKRKIKSDFEDDYDDKLYRLEFIDSLILNSNLTKNEYFSSPVPAYWYYEEAINCYYHGNFIATIVLSQVALEERLRNFFRVSNYNKFVTGRKCNLDEVGFADLINEAIFINLISPTEGDSLHHLRKDLRNIYVHSKDRDLKTKVGMEGKIKDMYLPRWQVINMKIKSNMIEPTTRREAEEALSILFNIYNAICSRSPIA